MLHTMMGRTACRPALGWPLSLQVLSTTCLCCICFFTKQCLPQCSCPSLLI